MNQIFKQICTYNAFNIFSFHFSFFTDDSIHFSSFTMHLSLVLAFVLFKREGGGWGGLSMNFKSNFIFQQSLNMQVEI